MMKLTQYMALVQNRTGFIEYLIRLGIFLGSINCSGCGAVCNLDKQKCEYRCHRRKTVANYKKKGNKVLRCNIKESARIGTFFHRRIGIQKMALFIGYFLELPHPRIQFMQRELNITLMTAIDWSNYCREVCINWTNTHSTKLGEVVKVVEVDEAKFGRRKDNRGRAVEGQWLFGGIERVSRKIFVIPVEDRTAETLVGLIRKWIEPGTTIMSDCWKSYDRLSEEGFQHLTVNDSYNFVDPDSGANTQSVERMWRDVRDHIPIYGRKKEHFVGYLSEYVFKRNVRPGQRIEEFLTTARDMYRDP